MTTSEKLSHTAEKNKKLKQPVRKKIKKFKQPVRKKNCTNSTQSKSLSEKVKSKGKVFIKMKNYITWIKEWKTKTKHVDLPKQKRRPPYNPSSLSRVVTNVVSQDVRVKLCLLQIFDGIPGGPVGDWFKKLPLILQMINLKDNDELRRYNTLGIALLKFHIIAALYFDSKETHISEITGLKCDLVEKEFLRKIFQQKLLHLLFANAEEHHVPEDRSSHVIYRMLGLFAMEKTTVFVESFLDYLGIARLTNGIKIPDSYFTLPPGVKILEKALSQYQKSLGYVFRNPNIAYRGICHESIHPDYNWTREAILGDSIIDLLVAIGIFHLPSSCGLELTKGQPESIRSASVSNFGFAAIAVSIGLEKAYHFNKNKVITVNKIRKFAECQLKNNHALPLEITLPGSVPKAIADGFESSVATIFLDTLSLSSCFDYVGPFIAPLFVLHSKNVLYPIPGEESLQDTSRPMESIVLDNTDDHTKYSDDEPLEEDSDASTYETSEEDSDAVYETSERDSDDASETSTVDSKYNVNIEMMHVKHELKLERIQMKHRLKIERMKMKHQMKLERMKVKASIG